jgi:hypothetical protein
MDIARDLAQKMAGKTDRELLAMFASPDDWTAEALNSARTELRNRGVDCPGGRSQTVHPETDQRDDRPDIYEFFGTYPNEDARLLLDVFVSESVRFTLDVDKMGVANISAFQAASGGTFGAGVGIAIGVHADDCDRAVEIRQRVLRIMP